jgi:hypothetical protein
MGGGIKTMADGAMVSNQLNVTKTGEGELFGTTSLQIHVSIPPTAPPPKGTHHCSSAWLPGLPSHGARPHSLI